MTAKEMLKLTESCAKQINEDGISCFVEYPFSKESLKDFISQLCKEQREICKNVAATFGGDCIKSPIEFAVEAIAVAPEPEL